MTSLANRPSPGPRGHTLSPKQRRSIAGALARVNLWDGSIRSGKTYASLLRFLTLMADPPTGGEIVVSGKNGDSIYRNVFAPFENEPSLQWARPYMKFKQGDVKATIFGRRVNIIGGNDNSAESRIRGMTVAAAYVDEVSVLPEGFFRQLLGRMSPAGAILLGTTNPDSGTHWLKTGFLDRLEDLPDWRYFHFTMDDNSSLSPAYKEAIKREYTGLWYDRFILGKWVAAEGSIYPDFNHDRHVINFLDLPPAKLGLGIGIDYGTTNASSALALYLGTDDRLYFTDEWRIDQESRQRPQTDAELSRSLQTWLKEPHHPTTPLPLSQLFIDPAATSFKTQLARDGVRGIKNANNQVLDGIKLISSLIATDRLRVSNRCAGLLQEVSNYRWDAKAAQRGQDKPVKEDDHSVDAARYAIASSQSWWRRHIPEL